MKASRPCDDSRRLWHLLPRADDGNELAAAEQALLAMATMTEAGQLRRVSVLFMQFIKSLQECL